jgi:hypothetical protein
MLKNGKQFGFCEASDFSDEKIGELFGVDFTS